MKTLHSQYFYGNKVSDYGLEHNRVDYRTLAKSFDAVLNNDIYSVLSDTLGYNSWELISGTELAEDGYYYDIFQWYIIDNAGAEILEKWTDEIVYYNRTAGIYLWGVTHYGTAWSYVLTDIEIDAKGE